MNIIPMGIIRAVAALSVIGLAWRLLPVTGFLLTGSAVMVAWAVVVLGRDLERVVAVTLLPVAIIIGSGAAGWVFVVSPAIDRAEARIAQLTHPALPDVGVAAETAVDRARNAVAGMTGGHR